MTPLVVPIALSEDRVARVQIPIDLTKDEAEKIARVVLAYGKPLPEIADEILADEVAGGLSLRKTALKHGTTLGKVRGALARMRTEPAS